MASLSIGSAAAESETLGAPASLLTIPSGAELLGLTPCVEKDAVVVSTQASGVTVQNVHLRQTLCQLTTPSSRSLLCPAIAHGGSYYAILSNPTELVVWTDATKGFQQSLRTAIPASVSSSPITQMHVAADRLWLAHQDGGWTWAPIAQREFFSLPNPWTPEARPAWIGVLQRNGRPYIAALYVFTETCRLLLADPAAEQPSFVNEPSFLSPTQRLLAATVHRTNMLLTLWADGTLRVTYFVDEASSTETITAFVLRFARLDPAQPAHLLSVNGTHALALCSEAPATTTAILVDTEYGSIQGSVAACGTPVAHATFSTGRVVFAADSQVYTLSVFCEEISLANAIGKLVPRADLAVEPPRADNTFVSFVPKWTTKALTHRDSWLVEQTFAEQGLAAVVAALCNTEKQMSSAAFDQLFESYQKQLRELGSPMPPGVVSKITARILAEPALLSTEALKTLLATEQVHFAMVPNIFDVLVQHRLASLCDLAMSKVAEIPEAEIVRCLETLLAREQLARYTTDKIIDGLQSSETPCDKFLRSCMSRPWTEGALVAAIAALPGQHALTLLAAVLVWFRRHCFYSPAQLAERFDSGRVPTLAQATEWLSLVLDAHYANFILEKKSHAVLRVLRGDLNLQTQMCQRAGDLTGILQHVTKTQAQRSAGEASSYRVDKLAY